MVQIGDLMASPILLNIITAVILIVVGIIVGNIVGYALRKAVDKARIEKAKGYSFFRLFITIIKWSIYILFLNLALNQLEVPQFTNWLTDVLVIIPALVGALLLIIVGFVIAIYLKDSIEDSKVEGWQMLSNIFFYFVLYVFMVFAFKTALISLDKNTVNLLVIILTTIMAAGIAYWKIKRRK